MNTAAHHRLRLSALALLVATAAFSGCSAAPPPEPAPPPPAAPAAPPPAATAAKPAGHAPKAPVALETYFDVRRVGGASFSYDEKVVAFMSDKGGRMDVWARPLAGGEATQLTHVSGFVQSFAFSPSADVLLFETDKGGDELPHIYLTDSKGGAPKDLMADYPAGARTEFQRWLDDGKGFLFASNLRDRTLMDLYEYSLDKKKAEMIWQAEKNFAVSLTSRDGKAAVVVETLSDADNNLYLVERGKKDKVLLTPHKGEVMHDAAAFSKDRRTLYYLTDEGREFAALRTMDLGTKKSQPALEAEWDVETATFSRTWKYLATTTNVDGLPKVALTEAATKKEVALPKPPGAGAFVPIAFSKSDRYVAATHVSDTTPGAVYVVDLDKGKADKVAEPLPAALASRTMVAAESVRIPSFDGKKVPAFVYKPAGAGPFPAVIDVHGGPTAQSRVRFDPLRQYLVSKGYVVLVPNVRGSTGYGKTYTRLDNMDLGGGPLQDVVACKKWLVSDAKVDASKVVVLGGSYGGYMALAAATFTPTEFAAHVDYFGVSDMKSLIESFPPYWMAFATYIYKKFGDPKNPEHAKYQHDRSPLYFVDKIQRPLLVVQGANDARVKKDQSDRMVAAIQKKGTPVHYLVLADEGHGFSKNENRLAAFRATDRFLDRYLWDDPSQPVVDGEAK